MSGGYIAVDTKTGYSPVIQADKAASGSATQSNSTPGLSNLGEQLNALKQQLDMLPAGPQRDRMLQIYQNLLEAGKSFERLSGKLFGDVPLQGKDTALDKARAEVEKNIKMLTDNTRPLAGMTSPAALEASAENLNNAYKQFKASLDAYSRQQQSATNQFGKQLQAVMTGVGAENLNSAHKQPETTRSQSQLQRSADTFEQQMKAAMTGSFAASINSAHDPEANERRNRQKRAAADASGQQATAAAAGRSALASVPMPRVPPNPLTPRPPYFPDAPIPSNPDDSSPWEPGGDFDMFWGMQQQIGQINSNYIKAYQYIMGGYTPTVPPSPDAPILTPEGGYTQFFQDMSKAMNDKVNYLRASSKDGQIIFDYHAYKAYFYAQMRKYFVDPPADTTVDPGTGKTIYRYPLTYIKFYDVNMNPDQRTELFNYWQNNLGAGFNLQQNGTDGIQVWIDTTILNDMYTGIDASFNNGTANIDMPSQLYSAWETKWNGNQNTVSSIVQRVTDLYSAANRTYDSVTRIMTSAFQACVDCAKEFLRV